MESGGREEAERKAAMPMILPPLAFGIAVSVFPESGIAAARRETESEFIAASLADRSCKRAPLCVRATRKTAAHTGISILARA